MPASGLLMASVLFFTCKKAGFAWFHKAELLSKTAELVPLTNRRELESGALGPYA
jgi:hypothetical protein